VDGHNFPNLPLMKISAFHKQRGDEVEFYNPLFSGEADICYMAKVFTFTKDYGFPVKAKRVIKGGTGYNLTEKLPPDIEHIYPDYGLYGIKDTAYGFLTRGCPRQCGFCIVSEKEGSKSVKAANLSEFWNGQKNIKLLDANLLACSRHLELINQLIDSGARVDFTQGLDARLLTPEIVYRLQQVNIKTVHFSIDNWNEKEEILKKLTLFKSITGLPAQKASVYILCNYNTTVEQDLERIAVVDKVGFNPYVMIYNREKLHRRHILLRMQRWANNKIIFHAEKDFYKYRDNRRVKCR
jgi:hypothetical protein